MKVNKNVEKAIKVLEASIDATYALIDMDDKGSKDRCMMEILGMKFAIDLLTDKKFLDKMVDNYGVK